MKRLLLILMSLSSCNDVQTGSVSLEEVAFRANVYGDYKLTDAGATAFNEEYFSTTTTSFSTTTGFSVNSYGTVCVFLDDYIFMLELMYSVDDTVSVYEVSYPSVVDSGSMIKDDRYVKISVDSQTNLSLYAFSNTKTLAESSTDSYIFGIPSYVVD